MERSINSDRFYLDYNSTSPLASSVIGWLREGIFFDGNPSCLHTTGKQAYRIFSQTKAALFEIHQLAEEYFDLVFHSGATEGINSIFKGGALYFLQSKEPVHFFTFATDHLAVLNLESTISLLGGQFHILKTSSSGEFDCDAIIEQINKIKGKDRSFINFTYVNNETGVVWNLEVAEKIKRETESFIHVDAVQSIGKIKNSLKISPHLDYYTYSGHKFGALKGVGYTFIRKSAPYYSLLTGGDNQHQLRSGTENTYGIYSIQLALKDIIKNHQFIELHKAFLFFENALLILMQDKGKIVSSEALNRCSNTLHLVFSKIDGQGFLMALDRAGFDVSSGSACSSGTLRFNRVLTALGYKGDYSLRLSWSIFFTRDKVRELLPALETVFEKFLK